MKNLVLGLLLTGLSIQAYGQEVFFKAKLKEEKLPAAILEAVETDFPDFAVTEYAAIPVELVEEDVYVDTNVDPESTYDTYQVMLNEGSGRTMEATYGANGKLMSTVERLKNIMPPAMVRNSVATTFPGWTIDRDVYKMVHYAGKKAKERYKFILDKKNKKMRVYTDEKGTILKVS